MKKYLIKGTDPTNNLSTILQWNYDSREQAENVCLIAMGKDTCTMLLEVAEYDDEEINKDIMQTLEEKLKDTGANNEDN